MAVTVSELTEKEKLGIVSLPAPQREVTGAYTGDLLSYVMSRAKSGDAWVTIMSNVNVIAVAGLTDVSCVILANSADLTDDALASARERGVNVLKSPENAYELCVRLSKYL